MDEIDPTQPLVPAEPLETEPTLANARVEPAATVVNASVAAVPEAAEVGAPEADPTQPPADDIAVLQAQLETLRADYADAQVRLAAQETDNAALRLNQLKIDVARETGVSQKLLVGANRTELEAHAEIVKDEMARMASGTRRAQPAPRRQSRSGLSGNDAATPYDARNAAVRAFRDGRY